MWGGIGKDRGGNKVLKTETNLVPAQTQSSISLPWTHTKKVHVTWFW